MATEVVAIAVAVAAAAVAVVVVVVVVVGVGVSDGASEKDAYVATNLGQIMHQP